MRELPKVMVIVYRETGDQPINQFMVILNRETITSRRGDRGSKSGNGPRFMATFVDKLKVYTKLWDGMGSLFSDKSNRH